jgi:hypothetical protein
MQFVSRDLLPRIRSFMVYKPSFFASFLKINTSLYHDIHVSFPSKVSNQLMDLLEKHGVNIT